MFGLDTDQLMRLVYLVALLAFLVGWGGYRRGWRKDMQHVGIWAIVALALVVVYAYRAPLLLFASPVLHELFPARVLETTNAEGKQELAILSSEDGHFRIDAKANGASVRFLVDT